MLALESKTSALLVMDYQAAIVDGPAVSGTPADKAALLARTASVIAAARKCGVRVIYVVVGFRSGYPEVSDNNKSFGGIRETGRFAAGAAGNEIHPSVAPEAGDVVVTKHRVGAFFGTDLDMILRANHVETLIFTGVATSGVVLSTIRHAADADYKLVVVADCCADPDPEVHRVLVEKVFARPATVVTSSEILGALS
ncbi:MAG: isochorismatase family cysteine hydrolase [Polyangiaceae bacterium]